MITATEFKNFIELSGTDHDSAIALIIAGVEKQVINWCKNELVNKSVEEIFDIEEVQDGDGFISLKNRINLSELKVYYNDGTEGNPIWTLADSEDYVANLKTGTIESDVQTSLKVTYKAGYTAQSVPDDLKLALLMLCAHYFNKRKSAGQSSEGFEGANVTFLDKIPAEIESLLQPYKSIRV